MMSVEEYALDVDRKVEEIIRRAQELGIDVTSADDMLDDEAITILDNNLDDISEEEALEDRIEEIIEDKALDADNTIKKEKLGNKKNKTNSNNFNKKEFANKKKAMYKNKEKLVSNDITTDNSVIIYKDGMTIGDLAKLLDVSASELIKKLFALGLLCTINSPIDYDNAELLVLDYKKELKRESSADVANFEELEVNDREEDLVSRPPVVTIMGHVDHGKTTLLDAIRNSNVALGEAGGITQAISAYQVICHDKLITFIDTPGHAAFTEMRARGASVTDIVIIIVAADDGVMPQTKEAIDHAKAAGVPIIVAINKMDKPGANPERIMTELSDCGLVPDEWGGDTLYNKISAKTGDGIEELLENILLVAELNNYRANPNRYAIGSVIESRLDKHVGAVVTLLINNGTLRLGDPIVVGNSQGKVRTLKNDKNEQITEAYPSQPVEVTGISDVPASGDKFMAFETEKQAKSVAETRKNQAKEKGNTFHQATTLEDLFSKIQSGIKEVNVLIKADVNGSAEAVKNTLEKIDVDGVKVKVIRSAVGAITESDIVLASSSNAIVIGFNIRPNNKIKDYAKEMGVEIRLYDIIYKAVEDMETAMRGMLDPEYEEKVLGEAEVRQLFKFSKVGTIAGCYVTDGIIKNNCKVRIVRDSAVIYDGVIASIQREKDSVKEVKKGLECGITIEDFNDIKVGDIFEAYEMVEIKR